MNRNFFQVAAMGMLVIAVVSLVFDLATATLQVAFMVFTAAIMGNGDDLNAGFLGMIALLLLIGLSPLLLGFVLDGLWILGAVQLRRAPTPGPTIAVGLLAIARPLLGVASGCFGMVFSGLPLVLATPFWLLIGIATLPCLAFLPGGLRNDDDTPGP